MNRTKMERTVKGFKLVICAVLLITTVSGGHPNHRKQLRHRAWIKPRPALYVGVGFGYPYGLGCYWPYYHHHWFCHHDPIVIVKERDDEEDEQEKEVEKEPETTEELLEQIEKLYELKEKGILTEEEYEEAKKELLARL